MHLVRVALEEVGFEATFRRAVQSALASLSDAALSGSTLHEALSADRIPEVADAIFARLSPRLVGAFVTDSLTAELALACDAPAWQRCVERTSFNCARDALPTCWRAFALWFPLGNEGARSTMTSLLIATMRAADGGAWDAAADAGTSWFEGRPNDPRGARLAAEVLAALKGPEPRSVERWVPVCFPLVYPSLRAGIRKPFVETLWKPPPGHWDEAEVWREWVTRLWLRQRYHARAYLLAFQGNARDVREALATIESAWWNYEFFGALLDEVEATPEWSDLRPMLAGLYNHHKPWGWKAR